MMNQYLLSLCYDGTDFHGWQLQPNALTVQAVLYDALRILGFGESPPLGCSRTDAGVHADVFCCTVRTKKVWNCAALIRALNSNLPHTVRVLTCEEVAETFHSRYDCVGKRYRYQIWNAPQENPFLLRYAHWERAPLDADKLNELAQPLLGTNDFTAFCASGAGTKTSVRTLKRADFEQHGHLLIFTAEADGFLYNMVRILAGTLLQRAKRPKALPGIAEILALRDRTLAGATLPPQGLFLEKVEYRHKTFYGENA
ncbi:MAG: tRNA pseudouridine(38-40) synthase TruA [Oscillospiraceae bacterium]|jgi:tRNA pseudouridine38-40 synthase|nr:tRNA pseudouridine(38-40) synthase TruA [Oscillospiraceae bacterium]